MARISCTSTFNSVPFFWGACSRKGNRAYFWREREGWMARCMHRGTMHFVHVGGPQGKRKNIGTLYIYRRRMHKGKPKQHGNAGIARLDCLVQLGRKCPKSQQKHINVYTYTYYIYIYITLYIYIYADPPPPPPPGYPPILGGEEGWTKWSVWRATVRSMATPVIIEVGPLPGLRRIPAD